MPSTYLRPYGAIDAHPLINSSTSGHAIRRRVFRLLPWCIGTIALVLFICQNAGLVRCPLNDVPAATKAALRQKWQSESEEHRVEVETWRRERAEYADEAASWEHGREAHKKELEDWQRQREEEERHRLELKRLSEGVYWTEPRGDPHCHAFGTRAYSAYLKDVPADLNWREVCDNMPSVAIHGGRNLTQPNKCEKNDGGEIVGTWYVDFGEPNCITGWGWFTDKGCTPGKPGFPRFESPLEDVRKGDDEQMMCETTPATVRYVAYDGPSVCQPRWSVFGRYMVGMWDVPDSDRCS